jgi:hypothetical protein
LPEPPQPDTTATIKEATIQCLIGFIRACAPAAR